MSQNSILSSKSVDFAVRVIALYDDLALLKEYILTKRFLRSGTSIGANIHEAQYAESTADFISKLSIANKKASETSYWIEVRGPREPHLPGNPHKFSGRCPRIDSYSRSTP